MKLVITGYIVRHPLAGNMCAFFHYVLGFHRLGHEVVYVEESGWPDSCYDPRTGSYSDDPSPGLSALAELADQFGMELPVCYVNRRTGRTFGLDARAMKAELASADLLLDIGGTCELDEFALAPRKALVDMDPLFTQVGQFAGSRLAEFDAHFTYGTNVGHPDCEVPNAGVDWQATLPPVVTDIWPDRTSDGPGRASMTTICNWGAYGAVDYAGKRYGQKDEEFLRIIEVAEQSPEALEIAIAGADKDNRDTLRQAGWLLRDAQQVTTDFHAYATYLGNSLGEFSVAKHAYVESRSGWFSDRSVCYLASGRPVVLQDTGASRILPESPSLLYFSTAAEAVEQLASLRSEYSMRCRAARELASATFGHTVVLPELLDRAFSNPQVPETLPQSSGQGRR